MILSSRDAGRDIVQAAIYAGQLHPPADIDALLDMIYAPLFFRLLVGHCDLNPTLADAIVATVFAPSAPSHF